MFKTKVSLKQNTWWENFLAVTITKGLQAKERQGGKKVECDRGEEHISKQRTRWLNQIRFKLLHPHDMKTLNIN